MYHINTLQKTLMLGIAVIVGGILLPKAVAAATVSTAPANVSRTVGESFVLTVSLDSSDQAMNAASGIVAFPTDKVEVVSVSKTNSLFNLWVQEPTFSNTAGTVQFEGIVLNPGFTGANGTLLDITFRAKNTGNANIVVDSAAVLANDGLGTNIVEVLSGSNIAINAATPEPLTHEITTPSVVVGTPVAPLVQSTTHPDSQHWYAATNAHFTWQLPNDATGVSVGLSRQPKTDPGPLSDGLFHEQTYTNLSEGVWYFHIKFQNEYGWGSITHYPFRIDTSNPEDLLVEIVDNDRWTDPVQQLFISARDDISDTIQYTIQINGGELLAWRDDGSHVYTLPPLAPGDYVIVVKGRDDAGNTVADFVEMTIKPLDTPVISDYPAEIQSGDFLIISGTAHPDAYVEIVLQDEDGEVVTFKGMSDADGNFIMAIQEKLHAGAYSFFAIATLANGAISEATPEFGVIVRPSVFLRVGTQVVNILTVAVPLVGLLLLLLFMVLYSWRKLVDFRAHVRKEVKEVEENVHGSLEDLRLSMRKQIAVLERAKRKGTLGKKEQKVITMLKKDVYDMAYDVEKYISAELQDIALEGRDQNSIGKSSSNIDKRDITSVQKVAKTTTAKTHRKKSKTTKKPKKQKGSSK